MAATHAAAAGFHRAAQEARGTGKVVAFLLQLFDARLRFVREQLRNDFTGFVVNALRRAEANHLLGLQLNRQLSGNFFRSQVKTFAGDGDGYRPHQHNGAAVELAVDRLFINTTNTPAVTVVDTVIHAQRLGDDKVTADHIDVRALERRIVQAHRQTRGDIQLQLARCLLNQFKGFAIGDTNVFMIGWLMLMFGQIGVDLRTRAVDQHQADAQAMQQPYIIDNA